VRSTSSDFFFPRPNDVNTSDKPVLTPHLVIAHPGHELLLHGWICRTKPLVHVLTDGSGHSAAPRITQSAEGLRAVGAKPGSVFGRLTDREAYAMIIEADVSKLLAIVDDVAADLEQHPPSMIVVDAVEGYNAVHDLCRLVAGAARAAAGVEAELYEFAITEDPALPGAAIEFVLDDDEHAAKLERARRQAPTVADIDELLTRYGADAYRREAFRRIDDWTLIGDGDEPPMYEILGEQRVATGRYTHVVRREHMLRLRDALCAAAQERRCAF
jgi:hypothetical protein